VNAPRTDEGTSLRAWLLGDPTPAGSAGPDDTAPLPGVGSTVDRLENALRRHPGVLAATAAAVALSPVGAEVVARELASALDGLLAVDLVDVLVGGWRKHHDLIAAARRTAADPEDHEAVRLATHVVTLAEAPTIDVFLDDVPVGVIAVQITVRITVVGLSAGIERGRLVAVRGGEVDIEATLAVEGVELARRQGHVDPNRWLPLGPGIPLLGTTRVSGAWSLGPRGTGTAVHRVDVDRR
jgi:hypothetical protein